MSTAATSAQRAQVYGLLKYVVPLSTMMAAVGLYIVMKDDPMFAYVGGGLGLLAIGEYYTLQNMATKAERQAQRDLG